MTHEVVHQENIKANSAVALTVLQMVSGEKQT
jgi:hypothetical protein